MLELAITAEAVRETQKAWGVRIPAFAGLKAGSQVYWAPKSIARWEEGVLFLPEWFARKKGVYGWPSLAVEMETGVNIWL